MIRNHRHERRSWKRLLCFLVGHRIHWESTFSLGSKGIDRHCEVCGRCGDRRQAT